MIFSQGNIFNSEPVEEEKLMSILTEIYKAVIKRAEDYEVEFLNEISFV